MSSLREIFHTNTTLNAFYYSEEMAASLRRESANPALTTEIDMLLNRINHLERLDRLN
ncbi:32073_t:CDS:1, partial [Gigaspora margarita]